MTLYQKDEIEQARANMLKTVRAAVRLRHAIEADNELNKVLPRAQEKFDICVNQGMLPDPIDIVEALNA